MGFGSTDYVHTFVEAKKLAFEDRARFYADLDFAEVPVAGLISKEYAAERARADRPASAPRARVDAGNPALDEGDTIYLTVADERRQHGLADPEQLPRHGLAASAPTAWASACRTAASCST